MKMIIVLIAFLFLSFTSCTKHQREGWEKRVEKISGKESHEESVDTLNPNNFSLAKEKQQFIGIKTTPVKYEMIEDVIELPAEIIPDPNKTTELRSPISGRIADLRVKIGDSVRKGDIVASIENPQNPGQKLDVRSPQQGTVTTRKVNIGEWVENGSELMDIVDYSSLIGAIRLYPDEQRKVRIGQRVELEIDGSLFSSTISYLSPSVDEATRTIEARAAIRNPPEEPDRLTANTFAAAKVVIGRKRALVIPASGILQEEAHRVAFVKEGERFEKRAVQVGVKSNGLVEILSGLREGELVVSEGAYQLKNITFTSKGGEEGEEGEHP